MKLHLGGHWDSYPEGFIGLTHDECDITKPLPHSDNSIDAIVLEHTNEHITLIENLSFFKEALRVLNKDGVLRVAMPTIDKIIQFKNDKLGKHYSDVQTSHYYPNEDIALKELGLEGVREEPIAFMMDSLFKGHNHRFLWTSQLLKKVLQKIGFSEVHIVEPGETHWDKSNSLERTIRGVEPNYVLKEFGVTKFDPETSVIEAKK